MRVFWVYLQRPVFKKTKQGDWKQGEINWFIVFCNQGKSSAQFTTQTCARKEERMDQNLQKNHLYENVSSKVGSVKPFYGKLSKSTQ